VLLPGLANRHGLVAGATGTGKTVTLRVLAEGFSRIGVPVFLADVKGDLSGVAKPAGRSCGASWVPSSGAGGGADGEALPGVHREHHPCASSTAGS
jgi:DNA helicase HerA-like ATPase